MPVAAGKIRTVQVGVRFAPARYARLREAHTNLQSQKLLREERSHVLPMSLPKVLPMCLHPTHPSPLPQGEGEQPPV